MPSERGPSAGSECARSVFNPSLDPVGHPLGVRQPLNTTIIKPAPCFRPSAAGATAAPDRVTPLSTSTHDPSTPPPSPGCTAATPSLSHGRWWQAVRRVAGADSHEATQRCDRLGTGSTDLASLLRPGTACSPGVPPPPPADGDRG